TFFKPGQLYPPRVMVSAISLMALARSSYLAKDLLDEVRQAAKQDKEYQQIIEHMRYEHEQGQKIDQRLSLREDLLWFKERLYIPNHMPLRLRLIEQDHDSKIAGHW